MSYDSPSMPLPKAPSRSPQPREARPLASLAAIVAALLASIGAAPPSADSIAGAAYPGARALFEREVAGKSIRIRFRCYATADPLEKVAAHYEKDPRFAAANWRMEPGERAFALRSDPELHVQIFPAANAELHRQCEVKPGPGDRTLLQISQASALGAPLQERAVRNTGTAN